ncbi:MAG: fatty acid desaturase [Gammaproteobacteria bacterium]|nr:fatty acid desaturase [Gammaproteobacteria bacterium]MDH5272572.1 fatty acid desaturase [Gammaproteobacteria bacterium]
MQASSQASNWNRKALLCSFETSRTQVALPAMVLLLDIALFSAGTAVVLLPDGLLLKLLGTLVVTVAIVRLFLVGHDACHGSFFSSSRLNAICGRIAFLPSMTAYSLWEMGHNTAHHGFNNLKGRDQVWAPYSKAEFDALPGYRRALERVYRSGLGWGAYYLYEMWWKKLFFASKKEVGSSRRKYKLDSVLVTVFVAAWAGVVTYAAAATGQSVALLLTLAVIVPFLLWNGVIGFVVFLHHTNPGIAWFLNRQEWQRSRAYLTSTACVRFPWGMDRLLHNIMEHNAHHLNPGIPMFTLREAQQLLRDKFPDLCDYRITRRTYMDVVQRCKLYDFANHQWLDFDGKVTARVTLANAAA